MANKLLIKLYVVVSLLLASNSLDAQQDQSDGMSVQSIGTSKTVEPPQAAFLTLKINSTAIAGLFYAEYFSDGRVILVEDAWRASNLNIPGKKLLMGYGQWGYDITSLPGASYELDIASQSIAIQLQSDAFALTKLSKTAILNDAPETSSLGVYVNYSLRATVGQQGSKSYGALVEGVVFNQYGAVVSSAVTSAGNGQNTIFRGDTYFQKDMPGNMVKVIIGDSITSAGAWSRPIRFGGIQWSTDFSLKRGFISMATPSIDGSAALPSTIDVFIDNQKSQSNSVTAGPFQISNLPTNFNGVGEINVVVKDILGVETISTQRFYSTARLLKQSLSEFSFEAGMERKNYGVENNNYDKPFIAGTYRRGFDGYTIEGHTEIQKTRQAIGIDVAGVIKQYAVMYFALAASNTQGQAALHGIAGIEHSSKDVNANLRIEHYDRDFVQMGASISDIGPRRKIVAGLGVNFYRNLWINTNIISVTRWNSDTFNVARSSLAIPFKQGMRLSAYATKQFGQEHSYTVGLNISLPLGETGVIAMNSSQDRLGAIGNNIQLSQAIVKGIGYQVRASDSVDRPVSVTVNAATSVNNTSLTLAQSRSGRAYRLRTNGSVGLLGGLPFASKQIGLGSFAVIKVADEPNVDIYQSNIKVARTNSNGLAMLPNMVAYQQNKISIKAEDIPFDMQVNETSRLVTPFARSGVFIQLDIKRSNNRLVRILKVDGSPVPIGSKVHLLPRNTNFLVARRGQVYLTELSTNNTLQVSFQENTCSADLSAPVNSADTHKILIVVCK